MPLFKQPQANFALSDRLAHQQVRVHRRAQSEGAAINGDLPRGTLVLSESQLGVGLGTHYAEIHLGIPAQRASVIVDTGSHYTALPCSTCSGCGNHTDVLFNVSKSTTAKYLGCHDYDACRSCKKDRCIISQSYVEGSMWQAEMVEELVWVGGFLSSNDAVEGILKTFGFRFPLGCQTKETGLFITQVENGIMGLGRHHSTVLAYMLQAGRVTQNLFTLCFAQDGGELVFGGVDYSHHTSDVGYTPLLDDKSAYYPVHVKDLRLNGKSLGIDAGTLNSGKGVIVDSGTTDTFFDAQGNRNFMKAFKSAAGREYSSKSMQLTGEELAALPIISIILSGMQGDGTDDIQLDIPASRYLTPSDEKGSYYGNFHFSERSGGVLGASAMIGFNVIFDTARKRVGFAESDCGKGYASSMINASSTEPQPVQTEPPIAWNTTKHSSVPSTIDVSHSRVSDDASSYNDTLSDVNSTITITALDDGLNPNMTTNSSSDTKMKQTSSLSSAFMAEMILISLVGVAFAVMMWTKWRTRSWSRIPDGIETLRPRIEADYPDGDTGSLLPPSLREMPLSPRSRGARKGALPTFTIGSPEKDHDDEVRGRDDNADSLIV